MVGIANVGSSIIVATNAVLLKGVDGDLSKIG